jgi:Fur family peroxide stress response transcriptional regulator
VDRLQQFIERCQAHRLKITPQRVAIYREITSKAEHPTADEVFRRVREEYPNISFDTVNRTLSTFLDIGVLDAVEVFGGGRRFDRDPAEHHHFHCTECRRVFDFYDTDLNNIQIPDTILEKFRITGRRLVLKGICGACLSKSRNQTEAQEDNSILNEQS